MSEVGQWVHSWLETIPERGEVQDAKVDTVVSKAVHPPNRLAQRHPGPRSFTELVRIVIDKPVGRELVRELLLAGENRAQREDMWSAGRRGFLRKHLNRDQPLVQPRTRSRDRVVRRAVVDEIHIDALVDEMSDRRRDDVL